MCEIFGEIRETWRPIVVYETPEALYLFWEQNKLPKDFGNVVIITQYNSQTAPIIGRLLCS